ncbi:nSTAND3 domain-containing NTPase [Leuconostoc citreum]|uniref:nSTAND3 domain-containing NTPase n=1 Tax=Leuconostoc citreum TaxID=33964 RepID=UPI0021A92A35|nr:restriction endonuclease [Leuconostoc citreum]MCT3078583.1 restriction endonuclease [Leuconostoc citreum]MCT3081662.1 restriction endonuclease [Leuconostoc citreum]MCT3083602.1 restriction endonuclease [Leuconostoc citreum]
MDISIRADSLTTDDFENFAMEIVKKKFNNFELKGFKQGKDDGIDGIDDIKNPRLIVQAKRWHINKNSRSALNLIKKEIDKIYITKQKFNWATNFQYVIVTSMGFSPSNLNEIRDYANKKLPDSMPSDDFIIFSSVLSSMAMDDNFKPIFKNFKLLESDLSEVLHEQRLESISYESLDYFCDFDMKYTVETTFIDLAYHILYQNHILLVQGPAGIGKTTTCITVANLFINSPSLNVLLISRHMNEINEVIRLYNTDFRLKPEKKLLVIFDDFLGHNKLTSNERELFDLKKLYSASMNSDNLYICLNSRTQIIQEASSSNSEFKIFLSDKLKSTVNLSIDLSMFSEIDRAKILRKNFERKYDELAGIKKELIFDRYNDLRNSDYLNIVQHKNFAPRLIASAINNIDNVLGNVYNYMIDTLNNPKDLYNNLFKCLSTDEKLLLLSLSTFKDNTTSDLNLITSIDGILTDIDFDLEESFEKLNGSWIKIFRKSLHEKNEVQFLNPSIIDFIEHKKQLSLSMMNIIINNAVYIEQLFYNNVNEYSLVDPDLVKNWYRYKDHESFNLERLLQLIKTNRIDLFKQESHLLMIKLGSKFRSHAQANCWVAIVQEILNQTNLEFYRFFIHQLKNSQLVAQICSNESLTLYDLNCIATVIDSLIHQLKREGDSNLELERFCDLETYKIFERKKISLVQDNIDDFEIIEEAIDNEYYSDEIEDAILEYVLKDEKNIWEELDDSLLYLDNMRDNIQLFILQRNDDDYSDEAYDAYRDDTISVSDLEISEIIDSDL